MAFGSMNESDDGGDLAEINMIPLIDVMLVLLVIFIVTAPLLTHAVKVDLPKAASAPNQAKPINVQLSIDAAGGVFWNSERVDTPTLAARMQQAGSNDPQPELHVRADAAIPYGKVAEVMSMAARYGVTRLGFVTDPGGATP